MKYCFVFITGALVGVFFDFSFFWRVRRRLLLKYEYIKRKADNHFRMFVVMQQWVRNNNKGQKILMILKQLGYNRIVLYGMNHFAETLIEELEGTDIDIILCVDKSADSLYSTIPLKSRVEEIKEEYDAIIVTAFLYYDEIASGIFDKVNKPIVSFEDLLFDGE